MSVKRKSGGCRVIEKARGDKTKEGIVLHTTLLPN